MSPHAGQVGSAAADMADKGANIASATTQQAKTFAAELEDMARRNPLGAVAEFVKDKPDHLLQPLIRIDAETEMPIPGVADRRRDPQLAAPRL
jgi:hypothetical protein